MSKGYRLSIEGTRKGLSKMVYKGSSWLDLWAGPLRIKLLFGGGWGGGGAANKTHFCKNAFSLSLVLRMRVFWNSEMAYWKVVDNACFY